MQTLTLWFLSCAMRLGLWLTRAALRGLTHESLRAFALVLNRQDSFVVLSKVSKNIQLRLQATVLTNTDGPSI